MARAYANTSVTGPSDPDSAWTSGANAFDGNIATAATNSSAGSKTSKYLGGQGTTAAATGNPIEGVSVRVLASSSGTSGLGILISDSGGTALLDSAIYATVNTTAAKWTAPVILSAPSGGWTYAQVQNLQYRVYQTVTSTTLSVYKIEFGIFNGGFYIPISVGVNTSMPAASTTRTVHPEISNDAGYGTVVSNQTAISPGNFILSDWKVNLATAPGAGVTRVQTFNQDGSGTALTFNIADPATSGSNTTDRLFIGPGSLISAAFTATGGTPAASTPNNWRYKVQASSQPFLVASETTLSTSAIRFLPIQGGGGAVSSSAIQVMPESGTLQNFYLGLQGGSLTSGSYKVDLFKNGASVLSFTVSDGSVYFDDATTISVVQGDLLYWQVDPTISTPSNGRAIALGMEYVSATSGNFVYLGNPLANMSNSATQVNNWFGNGIWQTTEANVQALARKSWLVGGYGVLTADTGSGAKTRTISFRQNGSSTATLFTFNNSGVGKSYTGNVAIATDDLINIQAVPSGTPTSSPLKYGLVFAAEPITLAVSVSDTTAVTENVSVSIPAGAAALSINVNDSTTVTENVPTPTVSYQPSVNDTTAVTDTPLRMVESYINKSDSTTVTDSVAAVITPLFINVNDATTVTENDAAVVTPLFINVNDTTTVTENSSVFIEGTIVATHPAVILLSDGHIALRQGNGLYDRL